MKMLDLLNAKVICGDLKSENKQDVIEEMVEILIEAGKIQKKQKSKIVEVLLAREKLGSTAIGQGIAIPHGKCDAVTELVSCLGISKKGLDFNSLDGEYVHIFFLLIAPIDSAGPHLKALAKISRILKDKFVRDSLKNAKDEKMILKIIDEEDKRLEAL